MDKLRIKLGELKECSPYNALLKTDREVSSEELFELMYFKIAELSNIVTRQQGLIQDLQEKTEKNFNRGLGL